MGKKVIDWKIITVIAFFAISCSFLVISSSVLMGSRTSMTRYYVKKEYTSSSDLFLTLIKHPQRMFVWCCDCILYYARALGITYEQLNIHLFVIVQPMLILMFMILFIIQSIRLRNLIKTTYL